jgi:molybdopterin synthase sulfur carrier subunit
LARVIVRLYADLRAAAGKDEVEIDAKSIKDLVDALVTKFGTPLREALLNQDGKLEEFYRIYVNKRIVTEDKLDETLLADGDIVQMFPPVAGGIETDLPTHVFIKESLKVAQFNVLELAQRWIL